MSTVVPARTPLIFGSPSLTGIATPSAFSAFKYPAASQQPPMISASAQLPASPSASFVFPGATAAQTCAAPATPVQQGVGLFSAKVTLPGVWGAPSQQVGSPQGPQPVQACAPPSVQMQSDNKLQKSCCELYMHVCNKLIEVSMWKYHSLPDISI